MIKRILIACAVVLIGGGFTFSQLGQMMMIHSVGGWQPSDDTGLRIAFDATDTSSLVVATNRVISWRNNADGSLATDLSNAAMRPFLTTMSNQPALYFAGAQALILTNSIDSANYDFLHNGQRGLVMVVSRIDGGNALHPIFMRTAFATGQGAGFDFAMLSRSAQSETNQLTVFVAPGMRAVDLRAQNAFPISQYHIATIELGGTNAPTAADRAIVRLDGGTNITGNISTASYSVNSGTRFIAIGAAGAAANNSISSFLPSGYVSAIYAWSEPESHTLENAIQWAKDKFGIE